jgi:hypothetical protein
MLIDQSWLKRGLESLHKVLIERRANLLSLILLLIKFKNMPYEHIEYCCNFCDREFDFEYLAEQHEKECDENPKNKQNGNSN